MRQSESWRPTKFKVVDGALRADSTGVHVSIGSRIIANLMANNYEAALRQHARGRLLDLGCGNVPLYEAYRAFIDDVVCVDWPNSAHSNQHIDVFADLTQSLPLNEGEFDTVLLSDVLEHIPNPEGLVGEIARVLAPGGRVIIGVPFMYWLHESPHDYNRYTRHQLKRLLNNVGLDVLQLREVGGSPEVVADIIAKTLAGRPRLAGSFVLLANWLLRRRIVRRVSQSNRPQFPLAYIVVAAKDGEPKRPLS